MADTRFDKYLQDGNAQDSRFDKYLAPAQTASSQKQSMADKIARAASVVSRGAVGGAVAGSAPVSIPFELLSAIAPESGTQLGGIKFADPSLLSPSRNIVEGLTGLGLLPQEPQNKTPMENVLSGVSAGASGAGKGTLNAIAGALGGGGAAVAQNAGLPAWAQLVAGAIPSFGAGAVSGTLRTSPERAKLAQEASSKGIDVPTPMLIGGASKRLESLLGNIGLGGGSVEKYNQQISQALGKTIGVENLTPQSWDESKKWIGGAFNAIEKASPDISDYTVARIYDVLEKMKGASTLEGEQAITRVQDSVLKRMNDEGGMSTKDWRQLVKSDGMISRYAKNPMTADVGRPMRDLFQDAFKSHLDKTAPDLAQAYGENLSLYRNLKVLETSAKKASPEGVVTPYSVISRLDPSQVANTEIGRIGQIANAFKPTPSSGTAENLGLMRLLGAAGGLGMASQFPETVGAVATSAALPILLNKAVESKAVRDYVIRNSLTTPETLLATLQRAGATTLPTINQGQQK